MPSWSNINKHPVDTLFTQICGGRLCSAKFRIPIWWLGGSMFIVATSNNMCISFIYIYICIYYIITSSFHHYKTALIIQAKKRCNQQMSEEFSLIIKPILRVVRHFFNLCALCGNLRALWQLGHIL